MALKVWEHTWIRDSICLRSGSSSCGWRLVKRGISILLRDARNALLNGSAGQSAAGLGSSPLESLLCRGHDSHTRRCYLWKHHIQLQEMHNPHTPGRALQV